MHKEKKLIKLYENHRKYSNSKDFNSKISNEINSELTNLENKDKRVDFKFSFKKTIKKSHINGNSKVIIPVEHYNLLDSYLKLNVRDFEIFDIFLPGNIKINVKLYHGENNNTPSYYEFRASNSETKELRKLFNLNDKIEYQVNLENRSAIISQLA
jgi:hypothetical protein